MGARVSPGVRKIIYNIEIKLQSISQSLHTYTCIDKNRQLVTLNDAVRSIEFLLFDKKARSLKVGVSNNIKIGISVIGWVCTRTYILFLPFFNTPSTP